ncbi:MAG: RimK family protein [Rhodospirillales bacterium]
MPAHIIVVDRKRDFPWSLPNCSVVPANEFVTRSADRTKTATRVINLCRDFSYLSRGYYCSLLAEARGQKVIPSTEVMLDLHWRRLLRIALPELNELLRSTFAAAPDDQPPFKVDIFFRVASDPRLQEVATRTFELFHCPILSLDVRYRNRWEIAAIRTKSIGELDVDELPAFLEALDRYTSRAWRRRRQKAPARYSMAILYDPQEKLPPSRKPTLDNFVRVGARCGVEVELITRADYTRLLEFDALFIRETTTLNHHTYRFAKKAETEHMPVIDDPRSILRCTNKIYLAEILGTHGIPRPRTLILGRRGMARVEYELGFPAVIKIPDSSFSRGVFKTTDPADLAEISRRVFKDSDLVIVQEYMETEFDWRVGVLAGKPIFVCKYFMAEGHWQILKHDTDGRVSEGRFRTLAVNEAPARVVAIATRAANLIGDGLYGVDLKETPDGVFVVEINDNPNIDAGIEDAVLGNDLYRIIIEEFLRRLDRKTRSATGPLAAPVP